MLSFRCDLDEDIEVFLHEKAENFQNSKWCNVYLLFNKGELISRRLKIEAYFTLSYKSMSTVSLSKSKIKKYGRFKNALTLNFVLIGQLGKWVLKDEFGNKSSSEITGEEILEQAFSVIYAADALIPSNYVMIECSDENKVREFYERNNFEFFQKDGNHNQYCRVIQNQLTI